MFRSAGLRFLAVGLLALVMQIPLSLVSGVVQERARYSHTTIAEIGRDWGGAQTISGPWLVIPVTEEVTYDRKRDAVDPATGLVILDAKGNPVTEHYEDTVTEIRPPVTIAPRDLSIEIATQSQIRHRGIFEVPVYTARATMDFGFDTALAPTVLTGKEKLDWSRAELRLTLDRNHALRGETALTAGGTTFPLDPAVGRTGGIVAQLGDPRALGPFRLTLGLNGAGKLGAAAIGRTTRLHISGDWPDPGFSGDFLPDAHSVTKDGFTADWTVPHLARALPQVSREAPDKMARATTVMDVTFVTPNDFYQKAWRAARYGLLFIGLTFLTILLLDGAGPRPAHPVQYLMVGLAQSVFVLLMLAYAEQIGFGPAYLLAAAATVALLTFFGATALRMGRRTWVLAALLVAVYAVLYLVLQSADYALLAGATLAFLALAMTMWVTRNEDWKGPERSGGWWRRKPSAPPATA